MKIDFIHRLDNRTLGIALLALGSIGYFIVVTDLQAIEHHLSNADTNLGATALVNARLSISAQIIAFANAVMLVILLTRTLKSK